MMSIISIISFVICGLVILFSLRHKSDFLSPGRVFIIVWTLVFGITDLKFSALQRDWSIEIWLQLLIGPVSFLLGVAIIYVFQFNRKVWNLKFLRNNSAIYPIDRDKLYRVILILFMLFAVSYLVIYLKEGQIPLLSDKPWKARAGFTIFGLGLFLHNVVLVVFLTAVYCILEKKNLSRKILLIFLSFLSIILYAVTLQRYQIFLAVFMVLLLLYYTTNRINYKTVLITAVLIIAFFYSISTLRLGEFVIHLLYKLSRMKFSPDYAIFTEPYMYVAMNLENLAHAVTKLESFTYGYYTFDFLTALTGLKHWISEYAHLTENPYLISINYNTYSAFWTFYRDFGILGIFTIPLIGGMIVSSLYYSYKQLPSIQKLAFYGMLLYAVIFSFFNSAFGFLWFVYNFVAIYFVFKIVTDKKSGEVLAK